MFAKPSPTQIASALRSSLASVNPALSSSAALVGGARNYNSAFQSSTVSSKYQAQKGANVRNRYVFSFLVLLMFVLLFPLFSFLGLSVMGGGLFFFLSSRYISCDLSWIWGWFGIVASGICSSPSSRLVAEDRPCIFIGVISVGIRVRVQITSTQCNATRGNPYPALKSKSVSAQEGIGNPSKRPATNIANDENKGQGNGAK